jgi:hypothetical protein
MKNFLFFITKPNKNGNWYYLVVNLENKTFTTNGSSWNTYIQVSSKKQLEEIIRQLKESDFKEVETRKECGF